MKAEWNGYLCSVVLRISEARDMGEVNRYALYEKMKTILAAPPPMHWIQTKYIPNYYAPNVTNTIITTNYGHDGLYLPPDDGRHHINNTEVRREDFPEGFSMSIGPGRSRRAANVVAYLRGYDLSRFNPKAPPRKTAAFWGMVGAGVAPEVSELNDAIDRLGARNAAGGAATAPCGPEVFTLAMLRAWPPPYERSASWLTGATTADHPAPARLLRLCRAERVAGRGLGINSQRQVVTAGAILRRLRFAAATALKTRLEAADKPFRDRDANEKAAAAAVKRAARREPECCFTALKTSARTRAR
jgi:hypothetical protein